MPFALRLLPYAVCAAIAAWAAWQMQGVRITRAEQALVTLQQEQEQERIALQSAAAARQRRAETTYLEQLDALNKQVKDGDALRRCIAAGKCGVIVRNASSCAGGVQAGPGADAAGADAIPAGTDATAEVIGDCAKTTLQLNALQGAIEAQPGYSGD